MSRRSLSGSLIVLSLVVAAPGARGHPELGGSLGVQYLHFRGSLGLQTSGGDKLEVSPIGE